MERPERPPLRRSRSDRIIAGVCGGIAEHLGLDPTLVRVAALLAAYLTSGGIVLAYLVLAIVMPEAPEDGSFEASERPEGKGTAMVETDVGDDTTGSAALREKRGKGGIWLGVALVVLGIAMLIEQFTSIDIWRFWPVLLIALGASIIIKGARP